MEHSLQLRVASIIIPISIYVCLNVSLFDYLMMKHKTILKSVLENVATLSRVTLVVH